MKTETLVYKTPTDVPNEGDPVDTGWDCKYGCKPGVISWESLNACYYKKFPKDIEKDNFRGFIYNFIDMGDYILMQ